MTAVRGLRTRTPVLFHRVTQVALHPATLFTLPAIIAIVLLIGFPLLYTAWLSLHRWFGSRMVPWEWVGPRNYADALFRDESFQHAVLITTIFAAATVAATLAIGTCLALLLHREFRGRSLALAVLLIPIVSTPVAVSMTWKYLLQYEGAVNWITSSLGLGTHAWLGQQLILPALVFVDVTRWTPLVTLILLAGLSALPSEPFEAAKIDGASAFQMTRYITLPLLRPFIGIAALIRVIDAVKTYDEIQVISGGGPAGASETLYMYGYKVSFTYLAFGSAAAVLILMFLIILAVSLFVVRMRRVG
jgi:multiple sugar transport system permease protein